mmetsp:Transcript_108444/g.350078  ORF Transcript_108444/g.350078 Transcript_108444/m.350078 type:complete len:207 (+) Transcript_108444:577-1197(+)
MLRGQVQWPLTVAGCDICVSPGLQQQGHDVPVATLHGIVQGSEAVCTRNARPGTRGKQQACDLDAATLCSEVQGCDAIIKLRAWSCLSRQEQPHNTKRTTHHCDVKGSDAVQVGASLGGVCCSTRSQKAHNDILRATLCGQKQWRDPVRVRMSGGGARSEEPGHALGIALERGDVQQRKAVQLPPPPAPRLCQHWRCLACRLQAFS